MWVHTLPSSSALCLDLRKEESKKKKEEKEEEGKGWDCCNLKRSKKEKNKNWEISTIGMKS